MKKLGFTIVLSLLCLATYSQEKLKGNKNVILQNREVEFFNKIIVKDDIKVMLSSGNDVELSVETDENLQDAVKTKITGGVLEIYLGQKIATSKKMLVYVNVADSILTIETRDKSSITTNSEIVVDQLNLMAFDRSKQKINCKTSTSNIIAEGYSDIGLTLTSEEFTNVTTEQNASVTLNLSTDYLNCITNNNSLIKPLGNCKTIKIEVHDNGNFAGKDMLADEIEVIAFDRSDASVNAAKKLEINAENNAEIYIYDNPEIIIKKFADKAALLKK